MNATEDFVQRCARRGPAHLSLIGPLLSQAPSWPDGPLIFIDGGSRWRDQLPGDFAHPVLAMGDGDSLAAALGRDTPPDGYLDLRLAVDKDVSDLGYALRQIAALPLSHVQLLGFLGGRRDHEWINFGEIAHFLSSRRQLAVDFAGEVTLLAAGHYRFDYSGTFSLVLFDPAKIFITGAVAYPLARGTVLQPHSSHGLSNRAEGVWELECSGVTMLFWSSGQAQVAACADL